MGSSFAGGLTIAGPRKTAGSDHNITVVCWHSHHAWHSRVVKRFKAIDSQVLPWEDPLVGGADPFIGLTRQGHVYATTASLPKLFRSNDEGRSWTARELDLDPPQDKKGAIRSFGILADDTFLLAYGAGETVYVSRSQDFGDSWQPSVPLDTSPYQFAGPGTHGFLLQLPDGTVLLPLGHYMEDRKAVSGALFIFRSRDGGRTWGDKSQVCFWGWEADLLRLHSGKLLIAVRYQRCAGCILPSDPPELASTMEHGYPKQVYVAESEDQGYTWKHWRRVTDGTFDVPGELVQLPDGTVVMIFAHRTQDPPPCGTWAMISRDEGRTWEENRYIINETCYRTTDWGFSASAVLKDGSILTLSGCRGGGWINRERLNRMNPGHIRAIRWRPDMDENPCAKE